MREIVSPLSGIRSPFGGRVDPYKAAGFRPALVADMSKDYYRSTSRQTFDDIFTTSRLGNATMVDSDGLLKWAPHNLLTYSEQFDNAAWTKTNATVTANAAIAPDGTLTADLITSTASGISGGRLDDAGTVSVQKGSYTIGAFFKAGSATTVQIRYLDQGLQGNAVEFDLSLVSASVAENTVDDYGISSLGEGWFYCWIEKEVPASGSDTAVFRQGAGEASGATYYIWGAHLYRSDLGGMAPVPADARVAGSETYVPTTSTAKYLPRRHNHVYNGSAWVDAGTLIETEARTNLITYSEDFTSWVSSNSPTVTGNAATSPDGSTNATALLANGTSGFQQITLSPTLADSTDYCFSVYFKAAVGDSGVRLALTGKDAVTRYFGALSDGSLSTPSGATNVVIAALSNGWYRLSGVLNSYSGATAPTVRIYMTTSTGDVSTMVSGDGIYIYGAQFEAASTPSSYTPTSGSTVTRAADTSGLTVDSSIVPWPTPKVIGEELVTNGGFDSDISGWTDQSEAGGSIAWNAAGIALTTGVDATQEGRAFQAITTVSGKVYRLTATRSGAASRFDVSGSSSLGAEIYISPTDMSAIDLVFVATSATTYLNLRNLTAFSNTAYIDNISVKEINPLAVCIQMKGRMTYADEDDFQQVIFSRWFVDLNNQIKQRLRTTGTDVGEVQFFQREGGTPDAVTTADEPYSPGINVPFNIASRHGSTFINGAVDGTALTADTTPVALPDLSSTDLQIGQDFMGNIEEVRIWTVDIGDTGIAEASS